MTIWVMFQKLRYDFSVHMQEDIPDTMIEMPK